MCHLRGPVQVQEATRPRGCGHRKASPPNPEQHGEDVRCDGRVGRAERNFRVSLVKNECLKVYTYPDICRISTVLGLDEQFRCIHEIPSCHPLNSRPLHDVLPLQIPVDSVHILIETGRKMNCDLVLDGL